MGGSGILAELLGLKQSYGIIRYGCCSLALPKSLFKLNLKMTFLGPECSGFLPSDASEADEFEYIFIIIGMFEESLPLAAFIPCFRADTAI